MNAPRYLITFKPGGIRFTYRVGGILIQREHVLCQSAGEEGFWFLPGGRAEVGESARASLLREMQEELGEALQVGRLLYVVENFFTDATGSSHELGLYFLLSAPAGSFLTRGLEPFTRQDEVGNPLRFDWLPIAQLEAFPLYPPFSKQPSRICLSTQYTSKSTALAPGNHDYPGRLLTRQRHAWDAPRFDKLFPSGTTGVRTGVTGSLGGMREPCRR